LDTFARVLVNIFRTARVSTGERLAFHDRRRRARSREVILWEEPHTLGDW